MRISDAGSAAALERFIDAKSKLNNNEPIVMSFVSIHLFQRRRDRFFFQGYEATRNDEYLSRSASTRQI